MKNLLIIGARGYGREVYSLAVADGRYCVKGFLDDKADALEGCGAYPPVIGPVETYEIEEEDVFVCALGDVEYKKKYAGIILDKGGEFVTLVHPTAVVDPLARIGKGCLIAAGSFVSCGAGLADFVTVQPHVIVGHDVQVGIWSHLNCRVFCGGFSHIGDEATIHTGTVILPQVKVGDRAMTGAGSIVLRDVEPGATVFGNPARTIKQM